MPARSTGPRAWRWCGACCGRNGGEASYHNGVLAIDQVALDDLVHLGTVSDDDGAVVYADDSGCVNMHGVPRIRFGRDLYPVIESP